MVSVFEYYRGGTSDTGVPFSLLVPATTARRVGSWTVPVCTNTGLGSWNIIGSGTEFAGHWRTVVGFRFWPGCTLVSGGVAGAIFGTAEGIGDDGVALNGNGFGAVGPEIAETFFEKGDPNTGKLMGALPFAFLFTLASETESSLGQCWPVSAGVSI